MQVFQVLLKAILETKFDSNIAIIRIFVEKWPLFSRSIISENTKDTEKLIRKKIFVIFCEIFRNFFRIFFSFQSHNCNILCVIHYTVESRLFQVTRNVRACLFQVVKGSHHCLSCHSDWIYIVPTLLTSSSGSSAPKSISQQQVRFRRSKPNV